MLEEQLRLKEVDEMRLLRASINVLIVQVKETNENLKKVIKE